MIGRRYFIIHFTMNMFSEPLFENKKNHSKMVEILFETFLSPAIDICPAPILAHYSLGDGAIVDIGHSYTQVCCFYEKKLMRQSAKKIRFGGKDLTNYLTKILSERGYSFRCPSETKIVEEIKEKLAFVALEYEGEIEKYYKSGEFESMYELPDGENIIVANEKFRVTEPTFNLKLLGMESGGLHNIVYDSIQKCDIDTRKSMLGNIHVIGGSTMATGFKERLEKEISNLAPPSVKVDVKTSLNRKYSTWIGSSILSCLSGYEECWTKMSFYNEHGKGFFPMRNLFYSNSASDILIK
eukprot:TRINITY_DN5141_c0_g1_i2.p1 TRINITY_DN5141_c0_g1~~TRINITY_DN5141_c0_g1_i2.p1  ORF type:complete len:297 (-),score=45.59 TRINITY_DN5141_c0_g1_i2:35-925(-)